ncbi:MAG: hypothetical protein ACRDRP_17965 [Pseudonocardiaceae bacterium]
MSSQPPDSERIFTGQELGDSLGPLPRGVLLLHDGSQPAGSRGLDDRWGRGLCLVPVLTSRYLSIRTVYQHIDLFLALLDEETPGG